MLRYVFSLSQKKLTCENYNPPQMCTPERYVTLKLQKRKLNLNRDYEFEIWIEKSEYNTVSLDFC